MNSSKRAAPRGDSQSDLTYGVMTGIGTRRPTFEERLAFMDEVRAMSEEELVAAYLTGRMDIVDQAWWTRHWQWRYSLSRDHLCYVNEAVQLLAWEANPPTLDPDSEDTFCRLARLNAHARRHCPAFGPAYQRTRATDQRTSRSSIPIGTR